MAVQPGRYARVIGTIGGLAVALGIGTAIAMNPSCAGADDGVSADGTSTDSQPALSGPSTAPGRATRAVADDEDDRPRDVHRRRSASMVSSGDEDSPESSAEPSQTDLPTRAVPSIAARVVDEPTNEVTSHPVVPRSPKPTARASADPVAPAPPPPPAEILGWARRELRPVAEEVTAPRVSPLATPEQLAAERTATETVQSLPVRLMTHVLRQQFLASARARYGHVDDDNMMALDRAVDEYAMAAAFQQQLLDSMNPAVITQVAPPHTWFGQTVQGSRLLYDNPDTIYRFMAVNGASSYVIAGRFHRTGGAEIPTELTFSVLEGLAGTTSSLLTYDELEINADGTFVITVSREPANGRRNHLQLTPGSTIIAARDTLGDWNTEVPMSLSITRVGGPPDSLFAQIGGFAFLGNLVSANPLLTTLVSLVPPLPYLPPVVRGLFAAAILVVRGANEQTKYMALATTDPETGVPRPVNTVSQPASNAEFLANQRQSNGHFQLADDQALVLRIDPGRAGYFVVPIYNIWTITDNYWDQPTSLNSKQARRNDDGTYTVVISPTDPGAANWVSTGRLHQGAIAIRFQDLGAESLGEPRILDQRVLTHAELRDHLAPGAFVTGSQRAAQLAARMAGFDTRWAPYPQP
ncbi:DUF1214 domain-containing protein [Mycobacterium sp. WMMD1722]|uniref:DUF1214 domain-containing protein n=1 Tax=Mycobacterium sp. WMMD1722 TaxID=3404117 RepID=UPI003BF4F29E